MKKIILTILFLGSFMLYGDEVKKEVKSPNAPSEFKKPYKNKNKNRGSWIWRAFAKLDDKERVQMLELQKNDPEKFLIQMRQKAKDLQKKEQLERKKLALIIDEYQKTQDQAQKLNLKKQLTKLENDRFQRHLRELKNILEANKRRVEFMDKELQKRKLKANEIIDARVEALLNGKIKLNPIMNKRKDKEE